MLFLTAVAAPAPQASELTCNDCHDQAVESWTGTVHGFLDCSDCHEGAEEVPHADGVAQVRCSPCHEEVAGAFQSGVHGRAGVGLQGETFGCESCHGAVHKLVPAADPASPVHSARLPETCGRCHADPEMARIREFHLVRPIEAYRASVHARAIEQGKEGADCSDCHGSHAIFAAADASSTVNHRRVPETCGRCHPLTADAYRSSVHGGQRRRGCGRRRSARTATANIGFCRQGKENHRSLHPTSPE